jgi:hypothetical protein
MHSKTKKMMSREKIYFLMIVIPPQSNFKGYGLTPNLILFRVVFKMALIHGQFVKLFNAFLLVVRRASPFSAWRVAASSESNTLLAK